MSNRLYTWQCNYYKSSWALPCTLLSTPPKTKVSCLQKSKYCCSAVTVGFIQTYQLKYGFFSKVPIFKRKKWHFERPNQRTDSKNLAKHPPKWWSKHLGQAFPFRASIKPILKNLIFLIVLELFHPIYRAKKEWQIFVYGSIILKKKNLAALLTYKHHWLRAISKIEKKKKNWDTLDWSTL